jgi:hypothetical protein
MKNPEILSHETQDEKQKPKKNPEVNPGAREGYLSDTRQFNHMHRATTCWTPLYTQTRTNNINNAWALLYLLNHIATNITWRRTVRIGRETHGKGVRLVFIIEQHTGLCFSVWEFQYAYMIYTNQRFHWKTFL